MRKGGIAPFLLASALLLPGSAQAEESKWCFDAWDGPAIPVRTYVPLRSTPTTPIVIVMHGASRDARRYFDDWLSLAEEHGLIVVVPEFSTPQFAKSARYNLGHVFDPDTKQSRAEKLWTFSAIEPLFDAVVRRVGGKQSHYSLYGHSAGAQFVHRFMYYKPDARAENFIAANAGWYTLPVFDIDYPYGLADSGLARDVSARIFAQHLTILLGSDDVDDQAPKLRQTPEARQQGPNRLARGLTMFRVAKALADQREVEFNWQLFVVEGADHDNAKMSPAAAAEISAAR